MNFKCYKTGNMLICGNILHMTKRGKQISHGYMRMF